MKLFMGVLFATLALNGVFALPARTEDAEVIGGPKRVSTQNDGDDDDFTNFKGVIDTGSGYPFLQSNPSVIRVGFFDSFDDLFRRLQSRLFPVGVLGRAGSDSDSDADDSDEFGISAAIDPKKANVTSTVKVVDGHKVEVNETVYGDENSVFKVRVVNIRPLEEGEVVEETEHKDIKPVTQGPVEKPAEKESNESEEKREPLTKKTSENEIEGNGNIDEPEHSTAKKENTVETSETTTATATTAITIDTTMLPTTEEDINAAAFAADNSGVEQQEYSAVEEELNGANGNGNNEFETNMSEENNNNNSNSNSDSNDNDHDSNDDNIDNVENLEAERTIENNEDTEEEANDNLNESSSSSIAYDSDKQQENNANNDDGDEGDDDGTKAGIEIVNLNKKNANYLSAKRNKEREDDSSSDDEDANASAVEMHPTFNEEWGSLNQPTNEKNDFGNDIDAYDVVPIDLSNDIAVNDAANLPLNPDAEFIDVYGVQHSSNSMPKFEKLSLDNQPSSHEEWLSKPTK